MKINDLYSSSQAAATYQNQNTQRAQEAEGAQAAKSATNTKVSNGSDEVSLSSLANILQDAITETPERTAYLKKLSSQFEAGTYKVDARQIASSLVDETIGARGTNDAIGG
jgi:flagellar biosynthesis anti-sigma factor FlgM